ncbi:Uncharacterised protein [Legionella beliardensis]|uniref:Transmembrane protein n=1 Tax=Legionella beliardensis TaxID=91822 RepID=A0A378I1D7_9GAMM|nr:hypothetical protein [Legionella beliardensis]STX28998.1 Uncharacterised protein [Legionella beliardensis]
MAEMLMNKLKNRTYITWSAIFSAAIAGVGLNFLLNLLALALGIASFTIRLSGKIEFSLWGLICFCIAAVIAMFSTGWLAGRLSYPTLNRFWGIFIGFLAWALLLIMTIILITNMIQFTIFHANFTSSLVAIKITNDAPMLTEIFLSGKAPLSVTLEEDKKVIVLNALITFIMFCVGALASCIGGYLGYGRALTKQDN